MSSSSTTTTYENFSSSIVISSSKALEVSHQNLLAPCTTCAHEQPGAVPLPPLRFASHWGGDECCPCSPWNSVLLPFITTLSTWSASIATFVSLPALPPYGQVDPCSISNLASFFLTPFSKGKHGLAPQSKTPFNSLSSFPFLLWTLFLICIDLVYSVFLLASPKNS